MTSKIYVAGAGGMLGEAIHKIFKDYNVHNEWYTYNYTMKELINCFNLKRDRKKKV